MNFTVYKLCLNKIKKPVLWLCQKTYTVGYDHLCTYIVMKLLVVCVCMNWIVIQCICILWAVIKIVFENHCPVCDLLESNDTFHLSTYTLPSTQQVLVALWWWAGGGAAGRPWEGRDEHLLRVSLHPRPLHSSALLILIAVLQHGHHSPCWQIGNRLRKTGDLLRTCNSFSSPCTGP